jgi:Putative stress-induced transcription regulator
MTGEELAAFLGPSPGWCEPPAVQPGLRPPAPGDLALVQSFVNSHYDLEFSHGADLFATPGALTGWLTRRGLLSGSETCARSPARTVTHARLASAASWPRSTKLPVA